MTQSRAVLFENGDDLRNTGEGGGNFTLYAYVDGTDKAYINGTRVWYFDDPQVQRWIFLNSKDAPMTYYWPNSDKLNFFAFMPDADYDGKDGYISKPTYVTVGSYSDAAGQTFSCELPAAVGYDTDIQEFIYAYEEEQARKSEPVELQFRHPFAAINFKVAPGSYRMTVKSIDFSDIYLEGDFATGVHETDCRWVPKGERQKYTVNIDKRITNDVNYNTLFDEESPFLVMPQEFDKIQFILHAFRDEDEKVPIDASVELSGSWLPGKKYVYTISVGDNNSEIYFNVEVAEPDDWTLGGENNIDVE